MNLSIAGTILEGHKLKGPGPLLTLGINGIQEAEENEQKRSLSL